MTTFTTAEGWIEYFLRDGSFARLTYWGSEAFTAADGGSAAADLAAILEKVGVPRSAFTGIAVERRIGEIIGQADLVHAGELASFGTPPQPALRFSQSDKPFDPSGTRTLIELAPVHDAESVRVIIAWEDAQGIARASVVCETDPDRWNTVSVDQKYRRVGVANSTLSWIIRVQSGIDCPDVRHVSVYVDVTTGVITDPGRDPGACG